MTQFSRYKEIIDSFDNATILVIGDVMLDRWITGKAIKISPEAPVPVIEYVSEITKLGGAANTINNIRSLGAQVYAIGVIGNDNAGQQLMQLLHENDINIEGVQILKNRPTIIKTRIIAGQQQIVRIDRETKDLIPKEIFDDLLSFIRKNIAKFNAIVISDYDKGVISETLLNELLPMAKQFNKPIIADPKVKHFLAYQGVTIVTPNLNEASIASNISPINETSIRNMGHWLLNYIQSDAVLITRGKDGITLFEKDGCVTHIPALAKEVFDITGAGDTVTGVFALAIATGANMKESAFIANAAAGIVVGKPGTATVSKNELTFQIMTLEKGT